MSAPSASIEFTLDGKDYVYKGELPEDIALADPTRYLKAMNAHAQTAFAPDTTPGEKIKNLLLLLGAKITAWNSIRPDGTIHAQDLPDRIIH
jgi:hypothetical protein